MVREIRGAKINPKSSFKNQGAKNKRGRKLHQQIRQLEAGTDFYLSQCRLNVEPVITVSGEEYTTDLFINQFSLPSCLFLPLGSKYSPPTIVFIRRFCKITKKQLFASSWLSVCLSVCVSVRPLFHTHLTVLLSKERIFMKFDVQSIFRKYIEKIKFPFTSDNSIRYCK